MGYRDTAEATAGELLDGFLRRQQAAVRSIHEHLFFRPLLDALTATGAPAARCREEAVATRLEAFGFTDAKRTRLALRELTKGLTRSSRLMQQMLPLLLGWLSESPDPDLGLLGLRVLAAGAGPGHRAGHRLPGVPRGRPPAVHPARHQPPAERDARAPPRHDPGPGPARRPRPAPAGGPAAGGVGRPGLAGPRGGPPAGPAALQAAGGAAGGGGRRPRAGPAGRGPGGRHRRPADDPGRGQPPGRPRRPRPAAAVRGGRHGPLRRGRAVLRQRPRPALRLRRLDPGGLRRRREGRRRRWCASWPAPRPPTRIYPVDLGLRPEGKDGPLARSLDGYATYYERWAQTWERQALVRARFVAGDADVGPPVHGDHRAPRVDAGR